MATLLDAWSLVGTTRASPGSLSISAGSDRCLVVAEFTRGAPDLTEPTTAISYGGQALTRIEVESTTAGADLDTAFWILDEAGIAAAEAVPDADFDVTPDSGGISFRMLAATFEDVDQTSLTTDNFSAVGTSGTSPTSQAMTTLDGSIVLTILACNLASTPSNDASYVSPLSEQIEVLDGNTYISIGQASISTTSFTPDATITFQSAGNRVAHLLAISLRPAVANVEASASSALVFGGTANALRIRGASATSALTFGGTATALRTRQGSASSLLTFGGTAGATRVLPASASSLLTFGGTANGSHLILASTTAPLILSGTANASEFTGARATGVLTFGGTANASPPIPIIPPTPLAVSVLSGQRPVILLDLFFDEGEINIWTRNFIGQFAQKQYDPLSGVTGGVTVRNSLDEATFDVSVQLSGQSEELLSIALTQNYRNRRANIILGNIGADNEIEAVETILPGFIVNMPITDDGQVTIVNIEIESVFRRLIRPREQRVSRADLALRSADDDLFDKIESVGVTEPRFGG